MIADPDLVTILYLVVEGLLLAYGFQDHISSMRTINSGENVFHNLFITTTTHASFLVLEKIINRSLDELIHTRHFS